MTFYTLHACFWKPPRASKRRIRPGRLLEAAVFWSLTIAALQQSCGTVTQARSSVAGTRARERRKGRKDALENSGRARRAAGYRDIDRDDV